MISAALLAAAALAATSPVEPHAAAEVFDQDYPSQAACDAALQKGREAGSPELRRLLGQAQCHAMADRQGARFHVQIRWIRSPLQRGRQP